MQQSATEVHSRPFDLGRAIMRVWASPIDDARAEAAAVVLLIPLLLLPAFWNGFPIIFYDTGAYLLEGLGRVFLAERSPVYSLFLDYAGAHTSLWLIALLQAAACAFVMVETACAMAPRTSLAALFGIGTGLVLLTGLPWYVGQIEPDCFAAVAALCIFLLAFHREKLTGWRVWMLGAIACFAAGAHPSHLLLGFALAAALAAYRGVRRLLQRTDWPMAELLRPIAVCVAGLGLIVASNHQLTGQFFVSRSGPAFVFARLLQDRIVIRLLDDTCPGSHYRLCAYKEVLPRTADQWLWGRASPFLNMGRFTGTSAESTRIIWDSLKRYPGLQAESALSDALRQFVMFKTGDQIEAQEWVLAHPFRQFIPAQLHAYLSARQQQSEIDFDPINRVHVTAAWVSLLGVVAALVMAARRKEGRIAVFLAFVLIVFAANAAICGALSNPHDRYQSRLIWLAPFALALIAGDHAKRALRRIRESGT